MSRQKGVILGFAAFAVMMLGLIFAAFPLQRNFGLNGLALTELMLLVIAVGFAIGSRMPLKELFYVKAPRRFGGSLSFYVGTYMLVLAVNYILLYLFPEGMAQNNSGILSFMSGQPFIVVLFIMAVMPAICEEAIHRGFILKAFGGIRRNWVKVLIMGLLFGIFHLDPYRFISTALLGAALTYIAIKTENFLMPVIFHFINNAIAVGGSYLARSMLEIVPENALEDYSIPFGMAFGYAAVYAGIAVALLYFGWKKLNRIPTESIPRSRRLTVAFVSLGMVGAGITLAVITAFLTAMEQYKGAF